MQHPTLHARVIDTEHVGFMTADTAMGGWPHAADVRVYMCDPPTMTTALSHGIARARDPGESGRFEQFDIR